jgi:nicotinamide-nucleotide amidase
VPLLSNLVSALPLNSYANAYALAEQLGHALSAGGNTVCVAESCTGGGIAEAITAIAGSSAWFDRGFVTYSYEAKVEMLAVPMTLIVAVGAVSEEVAAAMTKGALIHSKAAFSFAVTGIAGPGGGTPEKPVGTVCFGFNFRQGDSFESETQTVHFSGDRLQVRQQTILHALSHMITFVNARR